MLRTPHPTAVMRRWLVVQFVQEAVDRCLLDTRADLRAQGIDILEREDTDLDVRIEYRMAGRIETAVYLRAALEADAKGRVARWRI